MAFTLNGVGSYDLHKHEALAGTAQPIESDARCKKRERNARKALVARWVEQANVRAVPGAVTFGNHLWAGFRVHDAKNWDAHVSESQFQAELRSVLGRNLATLWRGRRGYLAVCADDVLSYQTGDDIDLLPGFDPAPPTDAERKMGWRPITRVRQAIRQVIADGCPVASTPYDGPIMAFDDNAWRPVNDTRMRAAFSRCYNVGDSKYKPISDARYQHALALTFKLTFDESGPLALLEILPARNAVLTIDLDGRMDAYPFQPVPSMNLYVSEPAIDWSDVDPITREYRPAVSKDAENHVLAGLFDGQRVTPAAANAAIHAAHVLYETRTLLQALAETEAAPAIPAPRRARL
ncbi:hypothetical protein BTH42_00535 [Burkholderia sp. SRS-W-2-2016]|uniref:hypothetical protein n=1 Tax=Burkholderia sp. SRS-W-2-2016 TaxID=1926878 RepID=UPI00094B7696|nr:hypothetical protein [Burkholderia sp. SRS-W-2-2016]OLL33516.1 hypothetical protein BTH42_00535 [Burkholderia sp. SRS-W-2-2016]